jgi:hypothetical protein
MIAMSTVINVVSLCIMVTVIQIYETIEVVSTGIRIYGTEYPVIAYGIPYRLSSVRLP